MIGRAWRALRDRSLLQKFALISLIAMTLIGLLLGRMLSTSVERQVLAGSIGEAEVVSRLGLQNSIGPNELKSGLTPERVRALQLALRSNFARIDVVDVVLWNLDGTVVFATETDAIGTASPESAELAQAAAGEPLVRVTDLSTVEGADPVLRRHGMVVEVYQPVRFGSIGTGETAGVLRTSTPYAPIAQTIADETRKLYLALVGAFLLLYAVLFRLVAEASSELRRRADENERQARHDALTGLPNRTLFSERLDARLERPGQSPLAIVIIDLDRFKEVNDTLGHHHGDLLLVEVGRRVQTILRPEDTVARLGGDEFALLLTDVADYETALEFARRVVEAIEIPFEVEGLRLDVGASLGVALAPQHGTDLASLLQRADIAMYQAKRTGSRYALYNSEDDRTSRRNLALAGELRRSVADELVVHYQPKMDLAAGRICGVEALVRWEHSTHGLLSPDKFVPLAERNGLMNALTRTVLEQSVGQLRSWLDGGHDLHLAVNVSARGLHDAELVGMVEDCLERHQVPAERLVLEITETTIAADPNRARQTLESLRRRGVRVSIDDFGTGYSSLAVLRSLPVNELKIDRRFVGDLGHPDGSAIVEYSVQLGHMLGLTVVAEGVERAADPPALLSLGCDMAQGYWFARPMPAGELTAWMASGDGAQGRADAVAGSDGRVDDPAPATLEQSRPLV